MYDVIGVNVFPRKKEALNIPSVLLKLLFSGPSSKSLQGVPYGKLAQCPIAQATFIEIGISCNAFYG